MKDAEPIPHKPGGSSKEERAKGLQAVAYFAGDTRRAAKQLEAMGTRIPRRTLRPHPWPPR